MEHTSASERIGREICAIGGHGLAVEGRIRASMQIVPPLSLMGRSIRGIPAGAGYASPSNCRGRWSGMSRPSLRLFLLVIIVEWARRRGTQSNKGTQEGL